MKKMLAYQGRSMFQVLASLAVFSCGYLLTPDRAVAEPDAIFQPILEEIRDRLPEGMVMRLPSQIEVMGVNDAIPLYTEIISNSNREFSVGLISQPSCPARFCQIGRLWVVKDANDPRYLQLLNNGYSITLKEEIIGTYAHIVDPDVSSGAYDVVAWKQDGLLYVASFPSLNRDRDKENIINIAKSMANERPIVAQGKTMQTWQEFVDRGGYGYITRDYDLPDEFRNGFIYWINGVNHFTAYIFKQGLPSYPAPLNHNGYEIEAEVARQYIQSGQAISLSWGFSSAGLRFSNDIEIRSLQNGVKCFRTFCLDAPFMSDSEIRRILMSGRPIGESVVLRERGELSNGDLVLNTDGSLLDLYPFEGQRGQTVKIDVASPEFDTYLVLLDSEGNQISANDDRQQNVTSSYLEITLPQTGTYTVLVNGLNRNSRGNYLVSVTTPDEYATVASNSSSQRTDTRQSFNTRQTYSDLQTFGVAQILNGNQSLVTARAKLFRAARNEYPDVPAIPEHEFLDEKFISISEQPGTLFGRRQDVSLSDYLKLKLKYQHQIDLLQKGDEIIPFIDEYQKKLQRDRSGNGEAVSTKIIDQFQNLWNLIAAQDQKTQSSVDNTVRRLLFALEETRVSLFAIIPASTEAGAKLALAFSNIATILSSLEPDRPEYQLYSRSRSGAIFIEYVGKLSQKFQETVSVWQQGNQDEMNQKMIEYIILVGELHSKIVDTNEIPNFIAANDMRTEVERMQGLLLLMSDEEIKTSLTEFDRFYLHLAGFSSALKNLTSISSVLGSYLKPGNSVSITSDRIDSINNLLFKAVDLNYKDSLKRDYEYYLVQTQKNQARIEAFSSGLEFSAQEVGQYLLDTRSDVVRRDPNGSIAVGVDGIVYPPN